MRFFEVDSAVDAVMGAATIAQQKASAMGKQGQLSMNGFLQMLANTGIVMDYEGFKSVFDTNPQLKNVIAKFDKDTITFASDADEEQAGYEEPQTDMPDDERVAKMAKRATKTREGVEGKRHANMNEAWQAFKEGIRKGRPATGKDKIPDAAEVSLKKRIAKHIEDGLTRREVVAAYPDYDPNDIAKLYDNEKALQDFEAGAKEMFPKAGDEAPSKKLSLTTPITMEPMDLSKLDPNRVSLRSMRKK